MGQNRTLYCTACKNKTGSPKLKGHLLIEVILWLCYIVPGLIYTIWRRQGEASLCPFCNNETLIPFANVGQREVECTWCAESILAKARVCKHCGNEVVPKYLDDSEANTHAVLIDTYLGQGVAPSEIVGRLNEGNVKCLNDKGRWDIESVEHIISTVIRNKVVSKEKGSVAPKPHDVKTLWESEGPNLRLNTTVIVTLIVVCAAFALMSRKSSVLDIAPFTTQNICKATISIVMGREPSVMSVDRVSGGVVHLSYTRSDGTHWGYRCKLQGNRAIWATDTGPWRGSIITYSIHGTGLSIAEKHADGSKTSGVYALRDL